MRNGLVVRLTVISIVLLAVSFLGPWWVVSTHGSLLAASASTTTFEFRLLSGTATSEQTWTCCYPNTTTVVRTTYGGEPNVGFVLQVASWLLGSALLSGVGMAALAAVPELSSSIRKLAPMLGILAFSLSLAACLCVMILLPSAAVQDGVAVSAVTGLWGSTSFDSVHGGGASSWGAGWCWYGIVVAAGIFLFGSILMFRAQLSPGIRGPQQPPQGL